MQDDSPKAEKQVEEANDLDASPTAEEQASEEVSEPEPTGEVEEKETGEKSKKESNKGYEKRVRQLVDKAKRAEERAKSLEEKLSELTAPVEPKFTETKQTEEPIVKPGEEIDASELDRRIKAREERLLQQADARAELRAKQSQTAIRLQNEANEVAKTYPELDPDSNSFNPDLSESITEAVEAHVRANPYSASVKNFVAKLMKPYKGAVEKEVGEVTEKIAKQVSETALRPTSVKGGDKKFEELTEEEMEKKLGMVY